MYITTAGITGIFIIAMFLFAPKDALTGRIVLGVLAVAAFLGTHSGRKGFAIACEFLIENRMEHRPHEDQK